jgi:hypothetical protein
VPGLYFVPYRRREFIAHSTDDLRAPRACLRRQRFFSIRSIARKSTTSAARRIANASRTTICITRISLFRTRPQSGATLFRDAQSGRRTQQNDCSSSLCDFADGLIEFFVARCDDAVVFFRQRTSAAVAVLVQQSLERSRLCLVPGLEILCATACDCDRLRRQWHPPVVYQTVN